MKRLNSSNALKDIGGFIDELINETTKTQYGDIQPQLYILEQLKRHMRKYVESFNYNERDIVCRFSVLFPKAIVKIESAADGCDTYMIRIYGETATTENKDAALGLADEIAKEYTDHVETELYVFLPTFITAQNTKIYYPEIYKELQQKS
jgi:hypothetical protein